MRMRVGTRRKARLLKLLRGAMHEPNGCADHFHKLQASAWRVGPRPKARLAHWHTGQSQAGEHNPSHNPKVTALVLHKLREVDQPVSVDVRHADHRLGDLAELRI